MRRYIDNALILDFIFIGIIISCLLFFKSFLRNFVELPSIDNLNSFGASLVTVGATLLGFLLTIVTVIVTFKKGFEDTVKSEVNDKLKLDVTEFPEETVFDKKVSKEKQFYDTDIHKCVVDVFVNAAYEIGIVILALLIVQFNIFSSSIFWTTVISICIFIMILLSIVRSLYVFKLFLNVHLHQKTINK